MKKLIFIIAIVVMLAISLIGCSGENIDTSVVAQIDSDLVGEWVMVGTYRDGEFFVRDNCDEVVIFNADGTRYGRSKGEWWSSYWYSCSGEWFGLGGIRDSSTGEWRRPQVDEMRSRGYYHISDGRLYMYHQSPMDSANVFERVENFN